ANVFRSSPRGGSESVRLMYLLSIASARRSIIIGNAYFVPDTLLMDSLVSACRRGVKVRILVPGVYIDSALVRRASRSRWGELLEAGASIHEFQPTMYHNKLLIVDGVWTSVGSTNFDNRSFRLNDEVNMNILDAAFAAQETAAFDADLQRSRPITLNAWKNRPWTERLGENIAGLLRSQL
ncbi:partial phospholipase D, partial [uncultured bacterium]